MESEKLSLWDHIRRIGLILATVGMLAFAGLILFFGFQGVSGGTAIPASVGLILFTVFVAIVSVVVLVRVWTKPHDFFHGHEKNNPKSDTTFLGSVAKDLGMKK